MPLSDGALFARYDRSLFLFFLLSLPLPFVLTGGQSDIPLLFCLLARISLRIPWAFLVAGGLSTLYDLLLYALFRKVPIPNDQ